MINTDMTELVMTNMDIIKQVLIRMETEELLKYRKVMQKI